SPGALNSSLTQPPTVGSMMGHSSVISTSRPLHSAMGYSVITSPINSSSVSLPSTPAMGFGALNSPQVKVLNPVSANTGSYLFYTCKVKHVDYTEIQRVRCSAEERE
ncbi:retinoic acid receptor RXR-gamma-B isoform X1, partial [Tachysurus ichikawai]